MSQARRLQLFARQKHTHNSSKYSYVAIGALILLTTNYHTTNAQESNPTIPDVDYEANALNNPLNKFCGLSYEEAHEFCHLDPKQSLPCPNGEEECPYGMPCWELEECTAKPTVSPTLRPSQSPITEFSDDPTDYYFCGLGIDELYDCAVPCPGGTPSQCPTGQLCYFDTPCDARQIASPAPLASAPVEESIPSTVDEDIVNINTEDSNTPIIIEEGDSNTTIVEEEADDGAGGSNTTTSAAEDDGTTGNRNFCGLTYMDASTNCTREMHCPSGLSIDCPKGLECFSFLPNCNVDEMPSPSPTLTLRPTSAAPTSGSPTITPAPTGAPIGKDDMRYFFFCGIDWMDASTRCYKQCLTGFHSECPEGELCFAQADCQQGLLEAEPTTPAPITGTFPPTITQGPSHSPTTTFSPSVFTTKSPEIFPTSVPTTAAPTDKPTFGFCEGEPCPQEDYCRSAAGFCGAGEHYCNNSSTWMVSCEDLSPSPTAAGSLSPTVTPSPSSNTSEPTLEVGGNTTYGNTTLVDDGNATSLDVDGNATALEFDGNVTVDEGNATENITEESPPPTLEPTVSYDIDEECNANPEDPLCSFFCGVDWNQAITDCPQRCPSGESAECPEGWSCYAFTPCLAIGINTAPTLKPTWEPTKNPVSISPTTSMHYWNNQNKNNTGGESAVAEPALWTASPTFKPTYSPTLDQCRGNPCEDQGECRSGLGFCGTGVVYCNTMSTWKPECIGGVSQLQSIPQVTQPPAAANKGGPPSISPTTKWDSWVNANYGTGDADAEPSYNTTSEEGGATNTTDLYTDNITESAEPTPSPVGDPFGWVSSGSFSGESYDAGDSESWWGSSGRSSGGNGMSSYYFIIAGLLYLVL